MRFSPPTTSNDKELDKGMDGLSDRLAEMQSSAAVEAKAPLQDLAFPSDVSEGLALLKILAFCRSEAEAGKLKPAADVIARLRVRWGGA